MKKFRTGQRKILLGVNIDHVATLRQARLGFHPDTVAAALEAVRGGADQITVHLREDRRHIQDRDLPRLKKSLSVPLNLEMALHPDILEIALRLRPEKVCIVPEKRRELTTEGGLDVVAARARLEKAVPRLRKKGIGVSLFIDAEPRQIRMAAELGADAVEIHTGTYALAKGPARRKELARISGGAWLAASLGLVVHAGHGLDLENVSAICRIRPVTELNIGHALVARAVFVGLKQAVREMKQAIKKA